MLYANCPGKLGSPWFCALYQKEPFLDSLKETYQNELRPLLLNYREETILRYEEKIAQSAWLNQIRWNTSDYTSQMEFVKAYLQERMAFLDTIWIENQPYNLVVVKLPERTFSYAVAPGESLPELPTFENTPDTIYHGWFDSDTDEPFDLTQPIKCETEIYLKSETIPEHNTMLIHYVLPAVMLIFTVIFLMTDIRRIHKNRNPEKKMRETEKKA